MKMKVKGINNGSKKTITAIKNSFAELLKEKGEINNITVTELSKRANITRGSFYSHYDSIYDVAQEIESDLQEMAFSNMESISSTEDLYHFIDVMFNYLKENENLYRKLMQSNDPIIYINRLNKKFYNVFTKIIKSNDEELDVIINFYISGSLSLLIKYYRTEIDESLDTLNIYFKKILNKLILER